MTRYKLILVLTGAFVFGSVLSIRDLNDGVKTKIYHRDPQIGEALRQQGQQRTAKVIQDGSSSFVTDNAITEYYHECPPGITGQLPYMYDCRRFLNCWKGRGYVQACGAGTVFNPDTLQCDSPDKVMCLGIEGGRKPPTVETSTGRLARLQVDPSAPNSNAEIFCQPDISGLQPHPHDCTKFLNCANGMMHIQNCGPGTAFSASMMICDFVHKVDCGTRTVGGAVISDGAIEGEIGGYGGNSRDYVQQRPPHGYRDPKTFVSTGRENQLEGDFQSQTDRGYHHHHHHNHHSHSNHHHHPQRPTPQPDSGYSVTEQTGYRDRWTQMNMQRPAAPGRGNARPSYSQPLPSDPNSWTGTNYDRQHTVSEPPDQTWLGESRPTHVRPTTTTHIVEGTVHVWPPSSNYDPSNPSNRNTTTTTIFYAQPLDENENSGESFIVPSTKQPPTTTTFVIARPTTTVHTRNDFDEQQTIPLYPLPTEPHFNRSDAGRDLQFAGTDNVDAKVTWTDSKTNVFKELLPPPPPPSRSPTFYPSSTTSSYPRSYDSIMGTAALAPMNPTTPLPSVRIYNPPVSATKAPSAFPSVTPYNPPQPIFPHGYDTGIMGTAKLAPMYPTNSQQPQTPPVNLMPPFESPVKNRPTSPPGDSKTNVRVFQIYPSDENATVQISPLYSSPYAGVAHSRNATWNSPTPITKTTPSPKPDVIFSREGGVVVPSSNSGYPQEYNHEYYRQTTPRPTAEGADSEEQPDTANLPLSEALRVLLRPYFNRSGTVTDDMATKAESHIMQLVSPPRKEISSPQSEPEEDPKEKQQKEVELIFAGEQESMSDSSSPPSPHQPPTTNWQTRPNHHSREFHRSHPHLKNPFAEEFDPKIPESSTKASYPPKTDSLSPTPEYVNSRFGGGSDNTPKYVPPSRPTPRRIPQRESAEDDGQQRTVLQAVDRAEDVCQFDCGNGKCIKSFEVCDGVNNCGNRRDEQKCEHLGYEVRLTSEDDSKHMGRVEVKILGKWGYVCDDKFGMRDADVLCRELGFPLGASEVRGNSFYAPTPDMFNEFNEVRFVMDEVDCRGNETSIRECDFKGWGVHDCNSDEVVGVVCKVPVMKCPHDYWLCSTSKECIPPAFLCDNTPDCSDQSDESDKVCNSTIEYRLANGGGNRLQGRVEVKYRGIWGTVCDDDFGESEAKVVCKSLGFHGPAQIVKNAFGPGNGPIWLDQISCFGNESSIDKCSHWSWGEHNCNHTEDVSIKCSIGSVAPTTVLEGVKGRAMKQPEQISAEDMDSYLYQMERSSRYVDGRKRCGQINPNVTDEYDNPDDTLARVVRGNVAKRGHHPWQATIRTKGRGGKSSHWCGAVLISKKHLLTAAHCLVGYPKGAYFIRLGDHYSNIAESSEVDAFIENWYIHEKFREGVHMNNDIAVIVLKSPVRFNDYIQPICLPQKGTTYTDGKMCRISGWGSNQSGISTPSNNLRSAEIPIIDDNTCQQPYVYGSSITEGMFCAGFLDESVDACDGDSGGPLVCSDDDAETLYGIISWGQHCGYANKPGVYVRVEKYVDWIYEKIRTSIETDKQSK